jgi:hypothetical protein
MVKNSMDKECECGGTLEKSMTDFKGIKEIPCWRCPKCGTEFFDAEQVEVLDKHLTEMIDHQISCPLDKEKKNEKDEQ